ncbi:hypothetical protein MRX96_001734 [Rhipicephalus microplus]
MPVHGVPRQRHAGFGEILIRPREWAFFPSRTAKQVSWWHCGRKSNAEERPSGRSSTADEKENAVPAALASEALERRWRNWRTTERQYRGPLTSPSEEGGRGTVKLHTCLLDGVLRPGAS